MAHIFEKQSFARAASDCLITYKYLRLSARVRAHLFIVAGKIFENGIALDCIV